MTPQMTRVVYLHGFASGPQSSKAQFFRARFMERGFAFDIPQLDEHDFEHMTISSQLAVVDRTVAGDRVILMGSSLGGYVAALYAARHTNVERLILLAPAFQFPTRWRERFAPQMEQWKRDGWLAFFHYAFGEDRPLGYGFVKDALQYEDEPDFRAPALVIHGAQDPVVPIEASRMFCARHPNAKLCEVDSGHELTDVLDRLWLETARFLVIPNPVGTG